MKEIHNIAFGKLSLHKVNANHGIPLYGCESTQNRMLELVVSTSHMKRSDTNDYYYTDKALIKVAISYEQLTALLLNSNAEGTPCTLTYFNGERIPYDNPMQTRLQELNSIYQAKINKIWHGFDEVRLFAEALLKKKNATKADINEALQCINYMATELQSNLPYIQKCSLEVLDKVKAEVDITISRLAEKYGLVDEIKLLQ